MPPRFAYWTILAGKLPTAFRAAAREELEPTFRRILQRHPDAELKWFARGKLWDSPEAAREALLADRSNRAAQGRRPPDAGASQGRGRDWRPGGSHRDPRQKFKDAKKTRNAQRRKERFARTHGDGPHRPKSGGQTRDSRGAGSTGAPRMGAPRTGAPGAGRPRTDQHRRAGPPGQRQDGRPATGGHQPGRRPGPHPGQKGQHHGSRPAGGKAGWHRESRPGRPATHTRPDHRRPRPFAPAAAGRGRPDWRRDADHDPRSKETPEAAPPQKPRERTVPPRAPERDRSRRGR